MKHMFLILNYMEQKLYYEKLHTLQSSRRETLENFPIDSTS